MPKKPKDIGLALSGGGFRATLFHLGVIQQLYDAGLLKRVTHICSVSGGSILAAHLVQNWEKYTGSLDDFKSAKKELLKFVGMDLRGRILTRLPLMALSKLIPSNTPFFKRFRTSRIKTFSKFLDKKLYKLKKMDELEKGPVLHILATNMTNGGLCSFTQKGFSIDFPETKKSPKTLLSHTIPISLAVSTSAAFPAIFAPPSIDYELLGVKNTEYIPNTQFFSDGGVFDNLGILKLLQIDKMNGKKQKFNYMIMSDASAEFNQRWYEKFTGPFATAIRASDILAERITDLGREYLDTIKGDRKDKDSLQSRLVDIRINKVVTDDDNALSEGLQHHIPRIRTDLNKFTKIEQDVLMNHGYSVAKQQLNGNVLKASLNSTNIIIGNPPIITKKGVLVRIMQAAAIRKFRFTYFKDPVWLGQFVILLYILFGVPFFGFNTKFENFLYDVKEKISPKTEIVIAGKDFMESTLLVEIMAQVIEDENEDLTIVRKFYYGDGDIYDYLINNKIVRKIYHRDDRIYKDLINNKIDLYPEYSGTILSLYLEQDMKEVRKEDNHETDSINKSLWNHKKSRDLEFLERFSFNNTYAIVMLTQKAEGLKIMGDDATLLKLATVMKKNKGLIFQTTEDFMEREDTYIALLEFYGLNLDGRGNYITHQEKYKLLASGDIDITDGYNTDPEIQPVDKNITDSEIQPVNKFIIVNDDQGSFPKYYAGPLVKQSVLAQFPEVRAAMKRLAGEIDVVKMSKLIDIAQNEKLDTAYIKDDKRKKAILKHIVRDFLIEYNILENHTSNPSEKTANESKSQ